MFKKSFTSWTVRTRDRRHKEGMNSNILVPLDDLLERIVIAIVAREAVGVDQSTKRVTALSDKNKEHTKCQYDQHSIALIEIPLSLIFATTPLVVHHTDTVHDR